MYNLTAFLYDRTAAFEDPAATGDDIHRALTKNGLQPPGLLGDLGSGTGLMSILLAERGWDIEGIELSAAMLSVAREKAALLSNELQDRLRFRQGDIARFEVPPDQLLDGAVCLCNTINHLTTWPQVLGFIASAYAALKPGGLLVLDSDTEATFDAFFHHGPVVVWDDGRHRMTRTCHFNPASGRADHEALLEESVNGTWQEIGREAMTLQHHRETALFAAFVAAGFQVEDAKPYNPNPKLYAIDFVPKILWRLRKPS